jgi:hypothetical protein
MQDELVSLKAQYGQRLRVIRKAPERAEGQTRRTPFPLQVAMEVEQCPPCTLDIDYLKVIMQVTCSPVIFKCLPLRYYVQQTTV